MIQIDTNPNPKLKSGHDNCFEEFKPFLMGYPRQFFWNLGKVVCIRDKQSDEEATECDSCPHRDKCKHSKAQIWAHAIHHARRMSGLEEYHFLVLRFKEGYSYDNFPENLWNQKYDRKCLSELNNHFLLNDTKKPYRVLKGQIRYYGTKEEFEQSEYFRYFDIITEFEPEHYLLANDVKAQEPLFSTVVTRTPSWIECFDGSPKVVGRLVTNLEESFVKSDRSFQILKAHSKDQLSSYTEGDYTTYAFWCCLTGELDKNDFAHQCAKCSQVHRCKLIRSYRHNVPGDWHSANAKAFLPKEYASFHTSAPKTPFQIHILDDIQSDSEYIHRLDDGTPFCISEECTINCIDYKNCHKKYTMDYKKYDSNIVTYANSEKTVNIPISHFPDRITVCSNPKSFKNDVRAIAKKLGLAVTYGGSKYTIANNIHDTQERAQELLDNFFQMLPQVKNHLENTKIRIAKVGKVTNLFGRIRDFTNLMWNNNLPTSQNMKNKGTAERTGLNYPIQSSAADSMKLAQARASDFIYNNHLSPFWGNTIPQTIPGHSHDILYHIFLAVHDETDVFVRKDLMDKLVPETYKVFQIADVFQKLGFTFAFEMDLEYDRFFSWTSIDRYPTSRVYILNSQFSDEKKDMTPNAILIDMKDLTNVHLQQLKHIVTNRQGAVKTSDIHSEDYLFKFVCINRQYNKLFTYPELLSVREVKSLGLKYKIVRID